jgi:dihydroflavonol-4-reductase
MLPKWFIRRFIVKVCVTGATGFIGANLVRALIGRGDEVRCLVRKPNICLEGLPVEVRRVPLVPVNDQERAALAAALAGCEGVYHVAGLFDPSPGGHDRMRAVHVDATRALVAEGARAGVRRLVLCSSSVTVGFGTKRQPGDEDTVFDPTAVLGGEGPLRAYHDTKLEAERFVRTQGALEAVIVNPDFIIGPWDIKPTSGQLIVAMARRWVPVFPTGGKCFQAAQDCAQGHILAMTRGAVGRRYLLANENLSYREFMSVVSEVVGRRPPAMPLPKWTLGVAGLVGRVGRRFDAHRFAGLDPMVLRSTCHERYRSAKRAENELGLTPTPIVEAVEAAHRWFRDHGYYQ